MGSKSYEGWEEERQARRERHRRRRQQDSDTRDERKQRVLHTRISEGLADDIRKVAEDLRVPVSNLVRNVLEDVFTVVESVADNVGDVVDEVMGEVDRVGERLRKQAHRYSPESYEQEDREPPPAPRPRRELPEFPDVVGWQPLILNGEQPCAGCERSIKRGARAFAGLRSSGVSTTYLCRSCASDVI